MALAGLAVGGETVIFSNANNIASTTSALFDNVSAEVSDVVKSTVSGVNNNLTSTSYTESFVAVSTNIGAGGSYTYTLTFTPNQDLAIEDISFDIFLANAGGKAQGTNRTIGYNFVLSERDGRSLLTLSNQSVASTGATHATSNASYTGSAYKTDNVTVADSTYDGGGKFVEGPRYGLADLPVETSIALSKDVTYTLSLEIFKGENNNTGVFAGIGNITMAVVPEPTTATLSLLALCGLAARRRRR